jgi:NAD(P)H-flavin reductase
MVCFFRRSGFQISSAVLFAFLAHLSLIMSGLILSYENYVPYYVMNIPGLEETEPSAPTLDVLLWMIVFLLSIVVTPGVTIYLLRQLSWNIKGKVAYLVALFSFTVVLAVIIFLVVPSQIYLTMPIQSPLKLLVGVFLTSTYLILGMSAAGIGCSHNLRLYRSTQNYVENETSLLSSRKTQHKRKPSQHFFSFVIGLTVIGLISFASLIFPPIWNWPLFDYLRFEDADDSIIPSYLWRIGPKPSEDETASGWVYPMVVPKLYLNEVIFFAAISTMLFVGLLSATTIKVRLLLRCQLCFGLNVGETFISLILFSLFFFESIYWIFFGSQRVILNALTESISVSTLGGVYSASAGYYAFHGAAARLSGHLAALAISLTLLPAPKTSILENTFAISTQSAITLHSRLGRLSWALTTSHFSLWLIKWFHEGNFIHNIFSYARLKVSPSPLLDGSTNGEHRDNFTIPIVELAWVMLTISLIIGSFMRDFPGWYALFQFMHPIAAEFFLLSALIHAFGFWKYAVLGLILLSFERVIRAVRVSTNDATIAGINNDNGIIRLVLNIKDFQFDCGQHVFLSLLPTKNSQSSFKDIRRSLERHPFSIASSPSKSERLGTLLFIIRDRNLSSKDSSWTSQIALLANDESNATRFSIDGPYSVPFPFRDFQRILLIAGGTGISGIIGIVEEILIQQQDEGDLDQLTMVDLIWSTKSQPCPALFAAVRETLYEAKQSHLFNLHLFISDSDGDCYLDLFSEIRGRPKLETFFIRAGREDCIVGAYVVGPREMAKESLNLGSQNNVCVYASEWS